MSLELRHNKIIAGTFSCPCGCEPIIVPAFMPASLYGCLLLIYWHFEKPITITSGYRCEQHNAKVNGSPKSKHLTSEAVDFAVLDVKPEGLAMLLDRLYPDSAGIGTYANHVHFDIRKEKARWTNKS